MLGKMLRIVLHMKRNILNGDFSLLKSLHRKYRFVKFLCSERGGRPKNGSKLLGKGTAEYLAHTFSLTWKLT